MPLSLGKYCAYWFVTTRLGHSNDTDPPEDGLLAVPDQRQLARRIVRAVGAAALTAGTHHVDLNPETFISKSNDWRTLFDVVDSMWTCARQIDASRSDPRAHGVAFADYMATRWVYRRVLNEEITARPADDEAFPPSYDGDAKRGLAETLAARCAHIGIELKNKESFVGAAARWRLLSQPRAALLRQVLLMLAMIVCALPAEAQLADAGGTADEVISVFFQKAKGDMWSGGIATHGEQALKSDSVRFNWQLDYGSLGGRRETPSGATPGQEIDVSKNSGVYTLSYVRNYSERWRVKADAGVEHRRVATASLIVNASARTIGAKTLWRGNLEPQAAWLLQGNVAASKALTLGREVRTVFLGSAGLRHSGRSDARPIQADPTSRRARVDAPLHRRRRCRGALGCLRRLLLHSEKRSDAAKILGLLRSQPPRPQRRNDRQPSVEIQVASGSPSACLARDSDPRPRTLSARLLPGA
jgi:hypothetical protein